MPEPKADGSLCNSDTQVCRSGVSMQALLLGRYWFVLRGVQEWLSALPFHSIPISFNPIPIPAKHLFPFLLFAHIDIPILSHSHSRLLYSQVSAKTVRQCDTGWCITRYACLLPRLSPGTHSRLGRLRLSRPGCLAPRRGGLPVRRRSPA